MKKIKVLHISKYYPPYIGGMESFCHDIVLALKKTDKFEQKVLCYNDKKETVEDINDGVAIIRVGISNVLFSQPISREYGKKLTNVVETFKPDIIHFMYPNPFAAHYLLKLKWTGILHLDWICDIIKQRGIRLLFKKQNKKLLKRANFVTSITPTYFKDTDYLPSYKGPHDFIACRIGDARMNVNKKQIDMANEIKKAHKSKKIIFFFGRHTEYKGLKYLIDSDKYLNHEKIDIVIAGQGELTEKLKKQAKKYSNIFFVGKLSDDDINSYLMATDIFAFPSITRNEAFGISLAEAMYFGKPACTFTIDGSGVNWVSINNITGLEASNKNVKEFADNLMRLVNDQNLYNRLSEASRLRCKEYFTKEVFDNKVISIYSDLSKSIG